MKTFKYFIFESYKLPAIQTVFGARSIEDKQETIEKKEKMNFTQFLTKR